MAVVTLLFHDVFDRSPAESGFAGAAADRYKLSTREFSRILQSLATLEEPLLLDPTSAEHGVIVTVDDGGQSYASVVADRVEALGGRGHCFVTTGRVGAPGFLTAAQIRDLDRRGHRIGSHSVSHPSPFNQLTPARMRREWRDSRGCLEDLLGHEVTTASLPGGAYSREVAHAASDSGVRVLFTSEPIRRVETIGACVVAGRFAIRPGRPIRRAAALVAGRRAALAVEWIGWNAKKVIKPLWARRVRSAS
jgi:peptidoglycan/xylan/chitin deacetylase (PgdA/CDA1 family)